MKAIFRLMIPVVLLRCCLCGMAQHHRYQGIYAGVPWFDNRGNTVSAHGAIIVRERGRYYLFGERHTDTSNVFAGFSCYASTDLYNWKWESIALPPQRSGKLGPNRVGERPKVMRCPATGMFVMYMHVDTLSYKDPFVGYATAKHITGPYTFRGPLLFKGQPIRKWDMGTFQDADGSGYVLLHGGDIYRLSDDYQRIIEQTNKAMERGFESPALFRKDSLYYFLGSDLTGWERNDNYYFTAASLKGPWTRRGYLAPPGTLTWNSQTTFVLPVQTAAGTTYMYMGDRWSYPKQASAATYVWQPLIVSGTTLSMPRYQAAWKIDTRTGTTAALPVGSQIVAADHPGITWSGRWQQDTLSVKSADQQGASFSITVKGTQVGMYVLARPDGGYAQVVLKNSRGKVVLSAIVDTYSKYPVSSLGFLSPTLPAADYTLEVSVLAENWYWVEKSGKRSGSKGHIVSLDKIVAD